MCTDLVQLYTQHISDINQRRWLAGLKKKSELRYLLQQLFIVVQSVVGRKVKIVSVPYYNFTNTQITVIHLVARLPTESTERQVMNYYLMCQIHAMCQCVGVVSLLLNFHNNNHFSRVSHSTLVLLPFIKFTKLDV